MKIIIVTGESPHHKYLCAQLGQFHEIKAILHPRGRNGFRQDLIRWWKRARRHGVGWVTLNAMGQTVRRRLGTRFHAELPKALTKLQTEGCTGYLSCRPVAHFIDDFGASSTLELIKRLEAEIVVCLGGPLYPESFIKACPLILNFHSGYSPVYNGTSTIWFAFANGQPHWCGGTLMVMNPQVDGGDILAHYLPEITPGDNPETLFLKTTLGAPVLFQRLLAGIEASTAEFPRVAQPRPFFYYRAIDWTVSDAFNVKKHLRQKTCGRHVRQERLIEYWRETTPSAARELFEKTTSELMWRNS